jgi:hypothetical protein
MSLSSNARSKILKAYRNRGTGMGQLWLHYSYKLEKDIILTSDYQLIWWILELETNKSVKSFELDVDLYLSVNKKNFQNYPFDGLVTNVKGGNELHKIGNSAELENGVQGCDERNRNFDIKVITKESLLANKILSIRWLKPIAYVAAIRGQEYRACTNALAYVINQTPSGVLGNILDVMEEFDSPVVVGILGRFAIQGYISLDLMSSGLNRHTSWERCKED